MPSPEYTYMVGIHSVADYSPFGVELDGRTESNSGYRYSFQGQEKDDEVKGEGNSVNYKYRMHDPRVGRFFAVDPLAKNYPHYSPYTFSGNEVISSRELLGKQPEWIAGWVNLTSADINTITSTMNQRDKALFLSTQKKVVEMHNNYMTGEETIKFTSEEVNFLTGGDRSKVKLSTTSSFVSPFSSLGISDREIKKYPLIETEVSSNYGETYLHGALLGSINPFSFIESAVYSGSTVSLNNLFASSTTLQDIDKSIDNLTNSFVSDFSTNATNVGFVNGAKDIGSIDVYVTHSKKNVKKMTRAINRTISNLQKQYPGVPITVTDLDPNSPPGVNNDSINISVNRK